MDSRGYYIGRIRLVIHSFQALNRDEIAHHIIPSTIVPVIFQVVQIPIAEVNNMPVKVVPTYAEGEVASDGRRT